MKLAVQSESCILLLAGLFAISIQGGQSEKQDPYFTLTAAKKTLAMPRAIKCNDRARNSGCEGSGAGAARCEGETFANISLSQPQSTPARPAQQPGNDQNPVVANGESVSELGNSALIVFQDKNNNYWFGSDGQGVYRYDGQKITRFSKKDGLCNDRIREIQGDKSGNVYFTTLEGISKFDGRRFTTLAVTESSASDGGWKLQPDDLWFKSFFGKPGQKGPYRYDGKSLLHVRFPKHHLEDDYYARKPNASWSPYEVYTTYKDSRGHMWFGTSNFGICRFDGKALSWMYEQHLTEISGGGWFGIRSIIEDKQGRFWFCNTRHRFDVAPNPRTENGNVMIKYKREKGIEHLKGSNGDDLIYFMSVIEDNNRDLWMATYGQGVWRYDGTTATHYPIKDGAKNVSLFSICKDKQGDLWLGTHQAGAYKFNGKTFEKFIPAIKDGRE